jgi:anti-anti-sigma regulatory factor
MNCETLLPVSSVLGNTIHTREAAQLLLNEIKRFPSSEIRLDFSNVDFISRSFADEFHQLKMDYITESNIKIILFNANEDVLSMLQAVSRTENKKNRPYESVQLYNFTEIKYLQRFILSF